jgi:hypothetical protein
MLPPAAPFHFVIVKPAAKITFVELIEQNAEVEVLSFLSQV